MRTIRTAIIPKQPTLAKIEAFHELHLEVICVFTAIGFFLVDGHKRLVFYLFILNRNA